MTRNRHWIQFPILGSGWERRFPGSGQNQYRGWPTSGSGNLEPFDDRFGFDFGRRDSRGLGIDADCGHRDVVGHRYYHDLLGNAIGKIEKRSWMSLTVNLRL